MRTRFRAALLLAGLALSACGLGLIAQAREDPRPYCRVTATALPTTTPGQYRVSIEVRPECPPNGHAYVRLESGRLYPWREVRPGAPYTSRKVPWYWRAVWRSQSGRALYEIPLPGMLPPWGRL